jgi:hypothetical protein
VPAKPADSGPQKYRFRVKSADGQEIASQVIELLARDAKLKNPRWGDGKAPVTTSHSKEVEMKVDAPGMDGRKVKFNVERLESGDWVSHTSATGVVKGGVVSAKIQAMHPAGHKKGGKVSKSDLAPVPLRFKVELA